MHAGLITGPGSRRRLLFFGPASKVHSAQFPIPHFHRPRLSVIFRCAYYSFSQVSFFLLLINLYQNGRSVKALARKSVKIFVHYHTFTFSLCRSLSNTAAAPFRVSSMISLGVIWTWRRELYSRIFRISSKLKSLLTIGFVIVLILSFQKCGGRIDQQILVTLQGCDGLYPSHCFYIYKWSS